MKAKNPWQRLPEKPPFILPEDKDAVLAFNAEERCKPNPNLLNLDILPVPFVGRPDAPVVLLGNIAGAGDESLEDYKKWPAYADRMRKNLLHENPDSQFLPFGPEPIPSHKAWWAIRLKHLLDEDYGNGEAAEHILARSILAVEFFPYRSCTNEYHHSRLSLTSSQEYSRVLAYNAMANGAVIVVRYGEANWFGAVRGLKEYRHLLKLIRKGRQVHITPKGFADRDGYRRVVDKIKASLASASGKGGS